MYTTITFISLLSYIGTAASVVRMILTAKKTELPYFLQFLSGICTAFFGGIFLRDLILLQTVPAALNIPWEIVTTTAFCIFIIILLKYKEPGNICLSTLCLLDSIGIVASTAIGYNQGAKEGILIAFACGFVTACGGDILATAIQMVATKNFNAFFNILTDNKWYYLFAVSMSVVYSILHLTNHNTNTAIMALTATAIVIGLIIERNKAIQR